MIKRPSTINQRFKRLAMNDPLTGLPNQRTLVATLDQELARSEQYHHSSSILYLDLDDIKNVNDIYGHSIGDAILREFTGLIRSLLRRHDTLGRWRDEEFLIILSETGKEGAQVIVERIHATLAGYSFSSVKGLHLSHLSCSIGIATYPTTALLREQLLTAADRNMYVAKQQMH